MSVYPDKNPVLLIRRIAMVAAVSLALQPTGAPAAGEANGAAGNDSKEIVFIPPEAGAPADRLGAGTRSVESPDGSTILLTPAGGGVSASGKPVLVWYFTEAVRGPLTISITPLGTTGSKLETTRRGNFPPGFQALILERSQAELLPGVVYRWEVRTESAGGAAALIEHRPSAEVPATAQEAAANGQWHDALAFLFDADFSGRIRLRDPDGLKSLAAGAGVDLTKLPGFGE